MPIISIIDQPIVNDLKVAYRPVVVRVSATRTDANAVPPVVYCDIYFNGIYYKSISKTQYTALNVSNSEWQFDIQDACQEVLKQYLATNGGSSIVQAASLMAQVYCKFRSSGYDADGFLVADGTAPIQGTGTVVPVAGTGTQSNSFYVVNATLQHAQNQILTAHLNSYKNGTWASNVFPLTHRGNNYRICKNDSDYFPVINMGANELKCLVLNYKLKGDTGYSTATWCPDVVCTPVEVPSFTFEHATQGQAYSKSITVTGTAPFTFSGFVTPSWVARTISSATITFSGTPGSDDVGAGNGSIKTYAITAPGTGYTDGSYSGVPVYNTSGPGTGATANVTVSGGIVTSFTIVNKGTGYANGDVVYCNSADIGGTGTSMYVTISAVTTNVIAFNVANDCGSVSVSKTIDVSESSCVPVGVSGTLPNATLGVFYSEYITLTGDAPFTLSDKVKPDWMGIDIELIDHIVYYEYRVVFAGTPDATGTGINVGVRINNCSDQHYDFAQTINVPSGNAHLVVENYTASYTSITGTCTINAVFSRTTAAKNDALAATAYVTASFHILVDNFYEMDVDIIFPPAVETVSQSIDASAGGTCGGVNSDYCTNVVITP